MNFNVIWKWLGSTENQSTLRWLGVSLVAVIGIGWVAYEELYKKDPPKPSPAHTQVTPQPVISNAYAENHYLWQTNSEGNDIHIIDIKNQQVIKRIIVGPRPNGIVTDAQTSYIYVTVETNSENHGELLYINPITFDIEYRLSICAEPHSLAITPNGMWAYIPCWQDGEYWVVDTLNKKVVKKIMTGGFPHNTSISQDGKYMFLSPMRGEDKVTILDVDAGHTVIDHIPYSNSLRPPALSADNKYLLQHIDALNGFQVADVTHRKVIATIKHTKRLGWYMRYESEGWLNYDGFHKCHGLAIHPNQSEIWSCCGKWVHVNSIIEPGYPEIYSIKVSDDVYWITFSPDGKYSFPAIADDNLVAMVDVKLRKVIKYFKVGNRPKRNLVITLNSKQNK